MHIYLKSKLTVCPMVLFDKPGNLIMKVRENQKNVSYTNGRKS